jgi:hypothetical protein
MSAIKKLKQQCSGWSCRPLIRPDEDRRVEGDTLTE